MDIEINDKSSHKQCFKCQYLPCINLYSDTKGRYGELYVLSKYKDVGIPPCSIGVFMYSLCQLTRYIYEKTQSPALEMYIQGLRDFKASIILLFTGHYRTSIALLRSVLEMFLVGIYFDARYFSAENEKKAEEILLEIEDFLNEKYEVPKEIRLLANQPHKKKLDYSLILEYLMRMGGIYKGHEKYLKRLKRDFEKLINELNGYIHAKRLEIIKPYCPPCPAAVALNRKEHETCIELMQTTFSLILKLLFLTHISEEHLKEKELWEESLLWITWIEEVQADTGLKLIFSKHLEDLIKALKTTYEEYIQCQDKS